LLRALAGRPLLLRALAGRPPLLRPPRLRRELAAARPIGAAQLRGSGEGGGEGRRCRRRELGRGAWWPAGGAACGGGRRMRGAASASGREERDVGRRASASRRPLVAGSTATIFFAYVAR